MYSKKFLNDLQLYDNDLFDEQVDTIPYLELNALVGNGQRHLGPNMQAKNVEFVSQACPICALKEARAQP